MKLILDTLERARLTASPAEAIRLADAISDLGDLANVLAALGMTLDEAPATLDDFYALRDHVASMPFETTDMDDGTTTVESLTPDAFPHWLAELERLAQ